MAGVFLVIGAVGVLVLLISFFVGELGELGLGDADADGPFSVPAIAALLGGVGFGGAAAVSLLPDGLPDAGAAAAPLSAVDKMTVISTDGAGALGKSVAANVAQGLQLSGDLTGIDVGALLRRLSGSAASTVDGVTRVPISVDGDGAAHNGRPA